MATYTIAAGAIGAYAKTLVASTVDTVTFADDVTKVEIGTTDGAAAIYFTTDGTTPTVGGATTFFLPATANAYRELREVFSSQIQSVKLISTGTPTYWVAKA